MSSCQTRLTEAITRLLANWTFRELGFRKKRTPYRVLVAEFMLQQTQTTTMQPYFDRFMEKWPTVEALAKAEEEDVYRAFAGLGYYRRAGYLLKTAKKIVTDFDLRLPDDVESLLTLPGIGPYTASAIASIAYGKKVAAVDGNIVRVLSRLLAKPWQRNNQGHVRTVKATLEATFEDLPDLHAGDVNEALMDLSATICKPKKPLCEICPMNELCLAQLHNTVEQFPLAPEKKDKKEKHLAYLILTDPTGVYVRRRTESLLKNTYEFIQINDEDEAHQAYLKDATKIGSTKHTFSHRIWHVTFYRVDRPHIDIRETAERLSIGSETYVHVSFEEILNLPFSSLFYPVLSDLK